VRSFAFIATVINYLSRQTLSVMAPVLLQQFRISATSHTGCIALISTATFGYSGALANLLAVPGDVFPKGAVASILGFASMGSGIGGMVFRLVTGWLVDHYSFRPAFVLFGVSPLVVAWMVRTLPRKAAPMDLPHVVLK
jgi:sugar phosphate permease